MAEGGYEARDVTIENPAYEPAEHNTTGLESNLSKF